tara:strand:- start:66 stop:329 length:264 start_codon:yes stop_codon:yes gene_type:complete
MKYKYNIKHKVKGKVDTINFKNKKSMLTYLDKHKDKLNKLISPVLYFNTIMLPLKQTVWYVKQLTERQQQKLNDKKKLDDFVSRLEK